MLGPRAVEDLVSGLKVVQGGFEQLWNILAQGRQRNRGSLSVYVSGVSRPCKAPRDSSLPLLNRRPLAPAVYRARSTAERGTRQNRAAWIIAMSRPLSLSLLNSYQHINEY